MIYVYCFIFTASLVVCFTVSFRVDSFVALLVRFCLTGDLRFVI